MPYERIFDKTNQPTDESMLAAIGQPLWPAWTALRRFLVETYQIEPLWNYGGPRYGWNIQHRKGGRPIAEIYPEHESFTALVILGKAELEQALARLDTFGPAVHQALTGSPRHPDGCWLYIRVSDPATCAQDVADIQQLVLIKRKPPRKPAAPKD